MLGLVPKRAVIRSEIKGFVYQLTDERILERLETEDTFTDVVSYGEARDRQLALLCFEDGVVSALAVMVRGNAVASYKRVVRFSSVSKLDPAVRTVDLLAAMSPALAKTLRSAFEAGGVIDPRPFTAVLEALESVASGVDETIAELVPLLGVRLGRISGPQEVIGFERDAVGIALDLAGLERLRPSVLRSWRGPRARAPFLEGLESRRFNEDHMIAYDMQVFGDWAVEENHDPQIVSFSDGRRQVTITSAHRTDVETSTGADLIYYSHDWKAYVLVQYKRMEHTSRDGWHLRPSRAGRLPEELARLKQLPRDAATATNADAFRLSDEPAYLKLCRQLHLNAGEGRLADGIYLPVSFYELLISESRGPRGGKRLTLEGLRERWLTNRVFVEMVGRGLIGSRNADTAAITEQIKAALNGGRSVTLAVGGPAQHSIASAGQQSD
jgi:hypothetical protein